MNLDWTNGEIREQLDGKTKKSPDIIQERKMNFGRKGRPYPKINKKEREMGKDNNYKWHSEKQEFSRKWNLKM